jgi:transcriptional regulator with XRE-family HTH domain
MHEQKSQDKRASTIIRIDQALVSKFESGSRKPTKEQVIKLAAVLEIDYETIMVTWLKEKLFMKLR